MSDSEMDLTPAELEALPVFPLPNMVFFPGTRLPLHLFEPRYRKMMKDCLERGPRVLAVARMAPGWENDYEGRPALYEVAGAGRILDYVRRPDDRYDLVVEGCARVKLDELPPAGLPYRRAQAKVLPDRNEDSEATLALLTSVLGAAAGVVGLVRQRHPDFGLGIDPNTPPGRVADMIADRTIADVDLRQRLLEQCDVKVRLALVQDALMDALIQLREAPQDSDRTVH